MTGLAKEFNLDRVVVVLVSTRNPLNIGAAARAMSNFGFVELRLVNPYEPSFREARSAVGAAELLKRARQYSSVAEAVADCTLVVGTTAGRDREPQLELRPLEEAGRKIRGAAKKGGVAILFGSEKRGLSNDDFTHCHWLMRIPTRDEHSSMNLGQAVAVCLYELIRDGKAAVGTSRQGSATAKQVELVSEVLFETLAASGYVKAKTEKATNAKLRQLIRRLKLSAGDAILLLGMLRKIGWKVKSK
jgi:TrmH family RNA methyltransferase